MHKNWIDSGYCQVTEQRLADQANQIRKRGWFSQAELEEIKQRSSTPAQSEDKSTHNAANVIHNQEQVNQCLHNTESDTISQEDFDASNHETTENRKKFAKN